MRLVLAVILMLLLCRCADASGPIPFVSVAGGRGPSTGLDGTLLKPNGPGPFPVVILLHGCGGLSANQTLWAERLNGWGYAALVLDSFTPRGVRSVCAPANPPAVRVHDRASDVISAALWLRTQPGIDPARIAVMGESHGGATAAWVTQERFQAPYPGLLKAAVDYYGACRDPATHGTVPLLVLAGEADDWGHPAQTCRDFGQRLRPGQPFELHTYPGVVHNFDNPRRTTVRMNQGHAMLYDQHAAEDSYAAVQAFLDRTVGPGARPTRGESSARSFAGDPESGTVSGSPQTLRHLAAARPPHTRS